MMLTAGAMVHANILTVTCTFDRGNSISGAIRNEGMHITYRVDDRTGRGFMEGNNGISEVNFLIPKNGLIWHIFEVTKVGFLMTTSFIPFGKGVNAVYSRHVMIYSDLSPQQYYGHCDVKAKKTP